MEALRRYNIAAEPLRGEPMKGFGIYAPRTLKIAKVSDAEVLSKELGLQGGDKIVAVDGKTVENYGQLEEIVTNTFSPQVTLQAQRRVSLCRSRFRCRLSLSAARREIEGKYDLSQICSMVPRLQVTGVLGEE